MSQTSTQEAPALAWRHLRAEVIGTTTSVVRTAGHLRRFAIGRR